ncbi:DUF1134 domain-containing protein [Kordiimonas sp. SCSIO 12610]|uniref:DUF1134 domain-containing protein n=1 Tax=Kordiimonas sp. SCSIO 12610 TaxID=2829597 RepID=UPI00210C3330|nr:EipA family protein [Kordiimonas sp. SCSIO 12610]UTW56469.1 DUF1134 domain-containing protein [Kordiimonas sp. SCSIO 12610]
MALFSGFKKPLALILIAFLAACSSSSSTSKPSSSQPRISTPENTYSEESIVDAGAGYLGKGAEVVAKALEGVFKSYGRPNAYITGNEAGGGLIVGLRYGGGDLYHKIEGQRPIHWTGPSIGFDAGADAVKTFALVYNLYDTEEIYTRVGALEGSFYFVGGLGVSVYGKKDVVIAIVRVGVGLRAQASVGYLKFTKKTSYLPF